jgi:hypothetical protein
MKDLFIACLLILSITTLWTTACNASEDVQANTQLELCLDEVDAQYVGIDGVIAVSAEVYSSLLMECECEIEKTNCE